MSAVLKSSQAVLAPMTRAHLARVMTIERDIYDFPWTEGNFRDSMEAGYLCQLYSAGSQLIGYSVVMRLVDEVHLLNLSIARAHFRRGHGRALLQTLLTQAAADGVGRMLLEVRPSNEAGRALYAQAGFAQIGVRRGYYPARIGREDALVLAKALP
jgi:[ribosomal protein S18]-alanine N-acetyltransferase